MAIYDGMDNILSTNIMNIMVEFECPKIVHLFNDKFSIF